MSYFAINRVPDIVTVQLAADLVTLRKDGAERWQSTGGQSAVELTTKVLDAEQRITLTAPRAAVKRIALRWQQRVPASLRFLGDHWERGYGDLEWRGLVPERRMPWYFLAYDGSRTHGYGVRTGASAICFWQVDSQGITLWLDVRNGAHGVELGTRPLQAAAIVSREGKEGESPFQAARTFCRLLCPAPVLPPQPVYGGNNWYYAYGRSSHQEILDDSKLIASLVPSTDNRPYMVIDDGWQLCHISTCNGGPWRQGNYLFPDMAGLAHQMRALGVRPGIWCRPLLTLEKVPEHWLLPERSLPGKSVGLTLDPSLPDVLQHVQEDMRCILDWGFELIKHDFSTFDVLGKWGWEMKKDVTVPDWSFADRSRTTAEIIRAFYQSITDVAEGRALVLGCNTIGHLAAGLFALQRTGDDTSGTQWERTRFMGVNTLAFRMPQHGTFFAVDADCVGLTKDVPWEMNRLWLDILARSGTPLFVSAAPDAIGPEQERALRAAFALAALPRLLAEPLDWLATTCPADWLIDGETLHYDWYEPTGVRYSFQ